MFRKAILGVVLVSFPLLFACASVPLAPSQQDITLKTFPQPDADKAGLYIFRDTSIGQGLKRAVSIDGAVIGKTANKTYYHRIIAPGSHTLTTESEFGENEIVFQAEGGNNYFAEQYIKMGIFVGGANLRMVNEEEGKKGVLECHLAR